MSGGSDHKGKPNGHHTNLRPILYSDPIQRLWVYLATPLDKKVYIQIQISVANNVHNQLWAGL